MKQKFFNNPINIISVVLIIIAIGLMTINKFIFKQNMVDYISGTITEIFGIIITVLFVQLMLDKKSNKDKRNEDLKKILRADKIINLLIEKYKVYLHCMIHDYKTLDATEPSLKVVFPISDMKHLHKSCLLMKIEHNRSSISMFYEIELELRNTFISIIQNIDFHYFPDISTYLLEYIKASFDYDSRGEILGNEKMYSNPGKPDRKKVTLDIEKMLENNAETYMEEYAKGNRHVSNVMFSYMNLYIMITKQKDVLIKYQEYIEEINHESSDTGNNAD